MNKSLIAAIDVAKGKFQLDTAAANNQQIDIQIGLVKLLHSSQWDSMQQHFFHGWMKKLDVSKSHYLHYLSDWRLAESKVKVSNHLYHLSMLMALRYIDELLQCDTSNPQLLKTCNVVYKVMDYSSDTENIIKADILDYLVKAQAQFKPKSAITSVLNEPRAIDNNVLPITVLFWEGPIARAYLESIKAMGFKVRKIIKLVSSTDLISKKPVGQLLPLKMRANYAANKQYKQIFYWPNQYKNKNSDWVKSIQSAVCDHLGFAPDSLRQATENSDLRPYTEQLDTLTITGLKDPTLATKLNNEHESLFLFTGGGIVPNELLSLENKKMIHIHPGYLPDIRGADCVLWSLLSADKLSASAFFLAPGIDVGDVIFPCWLPNIPLKFPKTIISRVKYRLIYGFLDPWVRAYVLQQAIRKTNYLQEINVSKQHESEGMTYHFMHEKMKLWVFDKKF